MNRAKFIKALSLGGLLLGSATLLGREKREANVLGNVLLGTIPSMAEIAGQDGEKLDDKLVQEFVSAGHGRVERVKELLAENPNLINTAHDWNQGDFETCLGAASHVGHLELARWLVEQGAQANIFTAALFGRMDIIKPMLDFFPAALQAIGPHGFTLLHHANKGGEDALEVKTYLESLGAVETKVSLY